ncbi:MAG: META domain-containing protein [Saprospiraceae bacterium]|nr:META domain-containing protein [Saprospiraceae bacterium]
MRILFVLGLLAFFSCTKQNLPMKTADLNGTNWTLSDMPGLENVPADMRQRTGFLRFDNSGRFSASAGCNTVSGAWTIESGKLSLKPGPSTLMACPEPLMKLEQQFNSALASADNYKLDDEKLLLRQGDTLLATFTKSSGER